MKNLTYSAISYVAAALILSGQALANPADVSGALSTELNDFNGHSVDMGADVKQGVYLALNRYPVTLPPLATQRASDKAPSGVNNVRNSEAYIDSLQRELRDKLDIIIESQDFTGN